MRKRGVRRKREEGENGEQTNVEMQRRRRFECEQ
jgi:hypothetical protein